MSSNPGHIGRCRSGKLIVSGALQIPSQSRFSSQPPPRYTLDVSLSPRFTEALVLAANLHRNQVRKGPKPIPYIGHLLSVAGIVIDFGGSEDEAIAALLHDAVEDQG